MRNQLGAFLLVWATACRGQLPAADVVARVNGEAISKQAFEDAVARELRRYGEQRAALPEGVVARLQESVLHGLIATRLVAQRAEAEGVEVTDAELNAKLAAHRDRFRSPEAYADYLARANTTEVALREELRLALLRDRVVDKMGAPQTVDEAEVRRHYEENAEQFSEPELLRAHRLFLAWPKDASGAERRKVQARMARLRQQAWHGRHDPQAFSRLCGEESEGAEAARGGDLGPLAAGRIPELDRLVAQGLTAGELSEVVDVTGGVALFRLDAHAPRRRRPLAEVHDAIHTALLVRHRNDHRQEALRDLQREASVQTFVSFSPGTSGTPASTPAKAGGPAGAAPAGHPAPAPAGAAAPAEIG